MNVTTQNGVFRLEATSGADDALIDQLDNARAAYVLNTERTPLSRGGQANTAIHLVADAQCAQALAAQSGREALGALGKLISLGLRESANHGHVGVAPANPQAQEQLATRLIHLQGMVDALCDVVSQQKLVVQEMQRSHVESPLVVETAIVQGAGSMTTLPPIGQPWPGQGGIYAGIASDTEGGEPGHLILLDTKPDDELNWKDAVKWGQSHGEGSRLFTKAEAALLFANVPDAFEKTWYWTGTQSSAFYAWYQHFYYGNQTIDSKDFTGRARAVRRLVLGSFNPLVSGAV